MNEVRKQEPQTRYDGIMGCCVQCSWRIASSPARVVLCLEIRPQGLEGKKNVDVKGMEKPNGMKTPTAHVRRGI
jgi:hypothetical protein